MEPDKKLASRRDFLKCTGRIAAASALAGVAIPPVHAAENNLLRVALIGCGSRGGGAVANCLSSSDNVKLIAMADAFPDSAKNCLNALRKDENLARKIDVPEDRIFVGFDAYKQAIAAGPDIVLLVTPPGFRPIHYAAAVRAGKHVFMEKPCCVDAPGFRSLMESNKLADEKGVKVTVGFQRRRGREYVGKVKTIQAGSLGDITLLRHIGTRVTSGSARVNPARPKWSTRCATGTTSSGSAATISSSKSSTIWTCAIGSRTLTPCRPTAWVVARFAVTAAWARTSTTTSSNTLTPMAQKCTLSAADSQVLGYAYLSSSTALRA